jgi:hypothetical protein
MEFNGGNPYIGRRKHIKFIQRNMHKCLCIKEVKLAKKDIIVTGGFDDQGNRSDLEYIGI